MEHPLTDNWFVLRDLTRPNAKRPAYRLLEEKGIEVFTPMRWQLVERKGKRIREEFLFCTIYFLPIRPMRVWIQS